MTQINKTTRCGRMRQWLTDFAVDRIDLPAWMRRHIDQCPNCRRRTMRYARAGVALRLVRTQPHPMGLLLEANRRTITMLRRDVRELPQADALRTRLPRASWACRLSSITQSLTAAATCLLVLLAVRVGILSSITKAHDAGQQAMEQYCRMIDDAAGDPAARHIQ